MADLFISYAREDRPTAALLAQRLEAGGRSVWWDREILPGKDFARLIAAELAQAKAVLVLWSPHSAESGWVRDEAREGLERGVLVPVLLGVAEPPLGFRSLHAVDLTGWEGGEHSALTDLELAVDALRTGIPVGDRPEQPQPETSRRRNLRRALGRTAALLALAAVGGAVWLLLPSLVEWRDNGERPRLGGADGTGAITLFQDCPDCPQMVALPPGAFRMGASWWDRQSQSDERPRVAVTVAQPVALGRTEVTFAQWEACRAAGGCARAPDDGGFGRDARPVIDVDWNDAQAYLAWLRARTGRPYRLPTEAEWEYACRAGTDTAYPFGDAVGPALANYDRQAGGTRPVASYPPNPWGLHDMNGNVWEWVEDVWNDGHGGRPGDAAARGDGPDPQEHVIKGGSWDDRDRRVRCASRNGMGDTHRENEIGFRVALPLDG